MTTNLNLRELEQLHPDPIVQRLVAVARAAIAMLDDYDAAVDDLDAALDGITDSPTEES